MTPITYRLRSGIEVRALRHNSGTILFADYRLPGSKEPTFAPDGTNLDEPAYHRLATLNHKTNENTQAQAA